MALDREFVSVKIGDNGEYLDGMLVDRISEKDWGKPIEEIIPSNALCRKAFRFIQIDARMKPLVDSLLAPVGFSKIVDEVGVPIPDPEKYRIRGGIIPLADLAAFAGKTEADIRDQTTGKDIINGLMMPETIFKSSQLYSPTGKMIDLASVSTGSFEIGAGSDDYATWVLFAADIAATLTGNLTGTQISDISQTAQCAINKALAGYALTLTSNTDHYGNFNSGWLTSLDYSLGEAFSFVLTCSSASSGASINISKLRAKHTGATPLGWGGYFSFNSTTTNITNNVNDVLIDGNSKPLLGIGGWGGASCIIKVFNYIQANGVRTSGKWAAGIFLLGASTTSIFENITIYNNTGGLASSSGAVGILNRSNSAYTFTNIACFSNSKDYAFGTNPSTGSGLGNGVASKCASSDTTGSEVSLQSLTTADQFESLTLTDGDTFLKLKTGATLLDTGVAPSIATNLYGIRGGARPHGALYSIGADEWVSVSEGNLFNPTTNKYNHLKSLRGGILARG